MATTIGNNLLDEARHPAAHVLAAPTRFVRDPSGQNRVAPITAHDYSPAS